MKHVLLIIMLLFSSEVWAASNDVLLNLKDPSSSNPLFPTLRVEGKADGATNPTVKVPMLPCVANVAAPTWAEGSIVPCSVDLAGGLRTNAGSAISNVNVAQLLGVAPSATNPFPQRLSNGVVYYDARDRNWTLSSGTDSIAVTNAGLTNLDVALSTRVADATLTNRFPAGSTPGDNESNAVTFSRLGVFSFIFDGVAWDRWTGAVSQSGTWNINNVSGTISLPTGAATEATLATLLTTTAFQARLNTLGQKTMAASTPVVLSSDQSAIPVTVLSTVGAANDDGSCPSGAVSFTVAASNASRTWLALWASPANTADVFVKLGTTATSADARIAPGQSINFVTGRIYTGRIDALPASGTQAVCVMELN